MKRAQHIYFSVQDAFYRFFISLEAYQAKHKRYSWRKFWLMAIGGLIFTISIQYMLASRYFIGVDPQLNPSIKDTHLFLVDKLDRKLLVGRHYAFHSKSLLPYYEKNTRFLKILVAKPGDSIVINEQGQIYINDVESQYSGLLLAEKLKTPVPNYAGSTVLKKGEYWFLGTHPKSFDSRYWGVVNEQDIIGRAYPLF